jgi:hypothetical protein
MRQRDKEQFTGVIGKEELRAGKKDLMGAMASLFSAVRCTGFGSRTAEL